jgi:hypothetical protein
MKNMVDERFECISVIFRLAGSVNYCDLLNDYMREVGETFAEFAEHEAVQYAKNTLSNHLGYDAVFKFAVHIEKKDGEFVFIEDIASLFDGRWNDGRAEQFLPLLNKFYVDTEYAEFFNSRIKYFEEGTKKFIDNCYGNIDFEWFRKYVDPSNLRCIISPSSGNYGATVNDKIIYCQVFMGIDNVPIVHEYCHSFANPLSDKWYIENPEFKKWCDDSVNMEKMPYYGGGGTMGREYVTRAYNILYCCQCKGNGGFTENGDTYKWSEFAPILMMSDYKNGFPYIEEVYKMILELEK